MFIFYWFNVMSFEHQIKQWVSIDNELKELNEKTKALREKRNALEASLASYATANHIFNNTIKFQDVKLKFANTKVTEPLTFRYLEKKLHEVIQNEEHVKKIVDYIKEKRESKIVPEIKRLSIN